MTTVNFNQSYTMSVHSVIFLSELDCEMEMPDDIFLPASLAIRINKEANSMKILVPLDTKVIWQTDRSDVLTIINVPYASLEDDLTLYADGRVITYQSLRVLAERCGQKDLRMYVYADQVVYGVLAYAQGNIDSFDFAFKACTEMQELNPVFGHLMIAAAVFYVYELIDRIVTEEKTIDDCVSKGNSECRFPEVWERYENAKSQLLDYMQIND